MLLLFLVFENSSTRKYNEFFAFFIIDLVLLYTQKSVDYCLLYFQKKCLTPVACAVTERSEKRTHGKCCSFSNNFCRHCYKRKRIRQNELGFAQCFVLLVCACVWVCGGFGTATGTKQKGRKLA